MRFVEFNVPMASGRGEWGAGIFAGKVPGVPAIDGGVVLSAALDEMRSLRASPDVWGCLVSRGLTPRERKTVAEAIVVCAVPLVGRATYPPFRAHVVCEDSVYDSDIVDDYASLCLRTPGGVEVTVSVESKETQKAYVFISFGRDSDHLAGCICGALDALGVEYTEPGECGETV
jgi:hypothetical protein